MNASTRSFRFLSQRSGKGGIFVAWLMAIVLFGACNVVAGPAFAADDPLTIKTVKRAYDDVRFDLQNAIINQGLKVDLNGHVGDMLKRTGADIGAKGDVFTKAEYFTFCSSQLTRAMVEADPSNLGLCPYTMFVYQGVDSEEVSVGYKSMIMRGNEASQKALGEINALMQKILDEVVE